MNTDELRKKLFAEMQDMSKEQLIQELQDAGYVLREEVDGGGLVNSDGTPFVRPTQHKVAMYSADIQPSLVFVGEQVTQQATTFEMGYAGDPNNKTYSAVICAPWIKNEDVKKQWTSIPSSSQRTAS